MQLFLGKQVEIQRNLNKYCDIYGEALNFGARGNANKGRKVRTIKANGQHLLEQENCRKTNKSN